MDSVAILGSGFGLYGYLPALVSCDCREIVLPDRYRKRFSERTELHGFSECIRWVRDEHEALRTASGAVLALCPVQQMKWLSACLEQENLAFLFLEKPLAASPLEAFAAQKRLNASNKVVRIDYLFRHLDWARPIQAFVSQPTSRSITFRWSFMAHHFNQPTVTWKREHEEGGGPLRFYGIHLIALLAELGYNAVIHSWRGSRGAGQLDTWAATFSGASLPNCSVTVSSGATQANFSIYGQSGRAESCLFSGLSPFETKAPTLQDTRLDSRVPMLTSFCKSAYSDPVLVPKFYQSTIELWHQVELAESTHAISSAA